MGDFVLFIPCRWVVKNIRPPFRKEELAGGMDLDEHMDTFPVSILGFHNLRSGIAVFHDRFKHFRCIVIAANLGHFLSDFFPQSVARRASPSPVFQLEIVVVERLAEISANDRVFIAADDLIGIDQMVAGLLRFFRQFVFQFS